MKRIVDIPDHTYNGVMQTGVLGRTDLIGLATAIRKSEPAFSYWTPVDEQQPTIQDEYLVTWTWDGGKRAIGVCEFEIVESKNEDEGDDGIWWPETYMKSYPGWKVLAWMPLPKLYKGGQSNEDSY